METIKSTEIELSLSCGLCPKTFESKLVVPEGWSNTHNIIEDENCLCPDHAIIKHFIKSQCPGCTGGWGDCPLWRSFAYSEIADLSNDDLEVIATGTCPKRVNGTMGFSRSEDAQKIDLRDEVTPSVAAAGKVLAEAIRAYWKQFGMRNIG